MFILEHNQRVGVALKNQELSIRTWNFFGHNFQDRVFSVGRSKPLGIRKQPWHHPSLVYLVFAIDTVIHCAV